MNTELIFNCVIAVIIIGGIVCTIYNILTWIFYKLWHIKHCLWLPITVVPNKGEEIIIYGVDKDGVYMSCKVIYGVEGFMSFDDSGIKIFRWCIAPDN